MTDYTELVKALRCCAGANGDCETECPFYEYDMCTDKLKLDAADAIEALQAEIRESMQKCAECGDANMPKRGEWIPYEFNTNGTWHKCSVCGVAYQYKDAPNSGWWINHKYCPNCGAKMEVKE